MQRMLNLALFCEYLLSLFKKWQFTIYVHFKIGKLPFAYLRTTYINICLFGILNVFTEYSILQNKGKKCLAHLSYVVLIRTQKCTTHLKKIQL